MPNRLTSPIVWFSKCGFPTAQKSTNLRSDILQITSSNPLKTAIYFFTQVRKYTNVMLCVRFTSPISFGGRRRCIRGVNFPLPAERLWKNPEVVHSQRLVPPTSPNVLPVAKGAQNEYWGGSAGFLKRDSHFYESPYYHEGAISALLGCYSAALSDFAIATPPLICLQNFAQVRIWAQVRLLLVHSKRGKRQNRDGKNDSGPYSELILWVLDGCRIAI